MFVLDTHVVSELRRPEKAGPNVLAWAWSVALADMFISALNLLELELGALSVEGNDMAQGRILRAWLDDRILPRFEGRILPVDAAVALRCARLHVPDTWAERDALIAATALVHAMTLATRNVADFSATGALILNPRMKGCTSTINNTFGH